MPSLLSGDRRRRRGGESGQALLSSRPHRLLSRAEIHRCLFVRNDDVLGGRNEVYVTDPCVDDRHIYTVQDSGDGCVYVCDVLEPVENPMRAKCVVYRHSNDFVCYIGSVVREENATKVTFDLTLRLDVTQAARAAGLVATGHIRMLEQRRSFGFLWGPADEILNLAIDCRRFLRAQNILEH